MRHSGLSESLTAVIFVFRPLEILDRGQNDEREIDFMNIVVILPTYNEKVNMEKMIPVLEDEVFPKIKHHHMQILVADDKSPDGTADVVRHFQKKYHNLHLLEGRKEGLGAAYVRAMQY